MSMQSFDDCANVKRAADIRLVACSRAIAFVGTVSGKKPFWLYINRGTVYMALRRYDLAVQDFDKSISMTPWYGAYSDRGISLYHLGEYDAAIRDFDRALETSPAPAGVYAERGAAYIAWGQTERGIQDLDHAAALAPDDPKRLNERCWIRAIYGIQMDKALADCNRAEQLSPGDIEILDTRSVLYFRMGNYPLAIADATAVLSTDFRRASALYVRGTAKLKLNNPEGNRDIADAAAIDPDVAATYTGYGVRL
jgi:tetratricopeptide (TPR) repeat protein